MWEPEQSWEALFFYSSSLFNPHSAGPAEISVALHAAECRSGLQGSERQRCNNAKCDCLPGSRPPRLLVGEQQPQVTIQPEKEDMGLRE